MVLFISRFEHAWWWGSAGLECVIDAVVADPPYGVRAGARKSEWKEYVMRPQGAVHFPATAPYSLAECLADLLDSSGV